MNAIYAAGTYTRRPDARNPSALRLIQAFRAWLTVSAAIVVGFSRAASAVVGTEADAVRFADRVVMVLTRGAEGSGFCTGVVLTPRVILTAGHCVRDPADMLVHYRDASGAPVVVEVKAALRHPDYRPDAPRKRIRSLDVGLVETVTPLPGTFRPAELANGEAPAPGDTVTVVGYGLGREGEPMTGGQLRAALLRVREPRSHILLWTGPIKGHSGACSGDSGGPMFDDAGLRVVGLVAWTEGDAGAHCGRLTQGILVAPLTEWIRSAIGRWRE